MSQYTFFLCLGGTGTQVGSAIGNLYPFLKDAKIAEDGDVYKVFIMDKDTHGKNYDYCVNVCERYNTLHSTLPMNAMSPYEIYPNIYQELQGQAGNLSKDYTVMDLIGFDSRIKELANMCWKEEKQKESLRDGNNRDPSRGSLDAHVCLEYFEGSSLFSELEKLTKSNNIGNLRLVILAGTTGGMGSSLIVPLIEKIKGYYNKDDAEKKLIFENLRIDLVLLGTYFKIPLNPNASRKVDEIGTAIDSYYRASNQLKELEEGVVKKFMSQKWWVYYVAFPGFDEVCGAFNKNGAEKRKAHIVELLAALAALDLAKQPSPAFYTTRVPSNKDGKVNISWEEIPLGDSLKRPIRAFMKCLIIVATQVYPRLSLDLNLKAKDVYITKYIKKPKDNVGTMDALLSVTKQWLTNMIPYVEFWYEVQKYSELGQKGVVNLFQQDEMEELKDIFINVVNNPYTAWGDSKPINKMPMCSASWMKYVDEIKPDKKELNGILDSKNVVDSLFKFMLSDIYTMLMKRKED